MEALERGAALGEVKHSARAVDVDAQGDVAGHREIVDGGEVVDGRDLRERQGARREAQTRLREVALDEPHAAGEARRLGRHRLHACTREGREASLNQADRRSARRPREQPRQERHAEEAGEAGEDDEAHALSVLRPGVDPPPPPRYAPGSRMGPSREEAP